MEFLNSVELLLTTSQKSSMFYVAVILDCWGPN